MIAVATSSGEPPPQPKSPEQGYHHVAVKTTVPFASATFAKSTVDTKVGDCALSLSHACGAIDNGGRALSWDLALGRPRAEAIEHLPFAALYETSVPAAKVTTPISDTRVDGRFTVTRGPGDVEEWNVADWPAMLGHNWGTTNGDLYAWSHINTWDSITVDGKPIDVPLVFEGGSARVRIGPLLSPMASAAFVRFEGQSWNLNARTVLGQNRGVISLRRWEVTAGTKKGVYVRADLGAETDDFVGLHDPNPRGSMSYCLNTKIARARIEIELPDRRKILAHSRAAALEIGILDPGHGVRMYV